MPWWPELQETFADLFKRAHRLLTINGFLVVADPYNECGDGRTWRLTGKPTSLLQKSVVPVDFARQCLESQHVRVQAVEQTDGVLHVYLYPPATMEDCLREGWQRAKESVVPTEITSSAGQPPTDLSAAALKKQRSSVDRLLKNKGWSPHEWASESHVDWHTVNDYLTGKTRPYPSTLKKLAASLGVKPEDLPE
jgi:Cro/C1-type HTH DNA-binding domain